MPCASSLGLGETVEAGDDAEGHYHPLHRPQQSQHRGGRADNRNVAQLMVNLHVSVVGDLLHAGDGLVVPYSRASRPPERARETVVRPA